MSRESRNRFCGKDMLKRHRFRAIIMGAVAASLYGGAAAAQNAPADAPAGTPQQQDTPQQAAPQPDMPEDVPPQFLRPENAAPQTAPAQNAPASGAQSAPSPADGSSDAADTMVGAWEFSNADRDKVCHFTFRSDPAAGGHKLDVDPNCPNLFPSAANMVGWSLDNYGDLHLLDGQGREIVDMSHVEGGMYDGFTPEEGRYILQAAAAAPALSADDLVGDWAITRSAGKPICVVTLANSPVGDALALTIKPGCDPFVMRFAPAAWRIDQGSLVLLSAHGQNWQFEENDSRNWQRVPETADPIVLTKQ
jgi:hypothetical protein